MKYRKYIPSVAYMAGGNIDLKDRNLWIKFHLRTTTKLFREGEVLPGCSQIHHPLPKDWVNPSLWLSPEQEIAASPVCLCSRIR